MFRRSRNLRFSEPLAIAFLKGNLQEKRQFNFHPEDNRRKSSQEVFDRYMEEMQVERECDELNPQNTRGIIRVPTAVNYGTSGTGKTFGLWLLYSHFLQKEPAGLPLFITFNDGDHSWDERFAISARINHRIIGALCSGDPNPDIVDIQDAVDELRAYLGMNLLEDGPRRACKMERRFNDPKVMTRILQEAVGQRPICLFTDELRKLGREPPPGEQSEEAVKGLKHLCWISQWGAFNAAVSPESKSLIYTCSSALAAVDPVEGVTRGSNRPCYHLPLAPLVGHYDKRLVDLFGKNTEALTYSRMILLNSQGNARQNSKDWSNIVQWQKDDPSEPWKQAWEARSPDRGNIKTFLQVVDQHRTTPMALVRALFWPPDIPGLISDTPTREGRAALLAESLGICNIIRTQKHDTVYMSAKNLLYFVEEVPRSDLTEKQKEVLEIIKCLCELIDAIPPHRGGNMGKNYEKAVHLGFVCRALLCEEKMTLGEFLGVPSSSDFLRKSISLDKGLRLDKKGIAAFPCAKGRGVIQSCSELPDRGCWYSDPDKLNANNLTFDSLLTLQFSDGSGGIGLGLGLQNKEYQFSTLKRMSSEWSHEAFVESFATEQDQVGYNNLSQALKNYNWLQVLITPNHVNLPELEVGVVTDHLIAMPHDNTTHHVFRTLLVHDNVRSWSPTLAFSACDARVLSRIEQ